MVTNKFFKTIYSEYIYILLYDETVEINIDRFYSNILPINLFHFS